ncbi:helix-turn-helix domain-containing protein [Paenibacillus dakarensis]|uniref:helix-turn-helix domain-containing protein n=1 Tax=Paenibacillus dakarensis TaxID=1527293 RepID=UPI00352096FA
MVGQIPVRSRGFSRIQTFCHVGYTKPAARSRSFRDYINRLRINKALWMLAESKLSILDISYECGFDSIRSFNRVFKQIMNTTPTEYKRK